MCRFHKDEIQFLGFIVLAQDIRIEKEKIETIKDWPGPWSVRDISVFFNFANFYRKFIKNFNEITASLTLMLEITNNEALSIQATQDKTNEAVLASDNGDGGGGGRVDRSIENLLIITNLAKSKKSKLTKPKKSDLINVKANIRTDFLIFGAKKAFIHLQKAFIKVLIFIYFDLKHYIWISADVFRYAIGGVLSQLTSDQFSSDYMTHENHFS